MKNKDLEIMCLKMDQSMRDISTMMLEIKKEKFIFQMAIFTKVYFIYNKDLLKRGR
jgi:hypothetical protein